ncbi:MAG TPA: hypothetical protein VF504_00935 [Solirubrobacterales bacterium]
MERRVEPGAQFLRRCRRGVARGAGDEEDLGRGVLAQLVGDGLDDVLVADPGGGADAGAGQRGEGEDEAALARSRPGPVSQAQRSRKRLWAGATTRTSGAGAAGSGAREAAAIRSTAVPSSSGSSTTTSRCSRRSPARAGTIGRSGGLRTAITTITPATIDPSAIPIPGPPT